MYPTSSVKLSPYPEYNAYIPQVNPSYARNADDAKYIVTTKIMVLALAVLFAVVFFVVCLHIYAKWVWSTSPAGLASFSFWRPRRHSDDVVDALDSVSMANMGLGEAALEALPKFRYEEVCEKGHLECPICLGKFEDGEMGRTLPKCGHCFHLECIDMWLFSHSTCPLCRAVLDPEAPPEPAVADPLPLPEEDKRDSIPANVLFWGNHELARLSINNNSSQGHVVIEVSHESLQLPPRGSSLHRLLGRGARVVVTPFRPSPSPSSSSSSSSSGVSGEH